MSSDNFLINPKDIKEKRVPRKEISTDNKVVEKYFNKGNTVAISYESAGRFSVPSIVYFKDFNVKQVSDFSMCKPENILENILLALNENKQSEKEFDCFDMTLEEFLETLVGIKLKFNTKFHTHRHVCGCQDIVRDSEKKIIEHIVDLSTLSYTSIQDVDNNLKEYVKGILEQYTTEDYKEFLFIKYKDNPLADIDNWTIDKEVDSITFQEPIHFHNIYDGKNYTFRLMRMRDIVDAQHIVSKKYALKYSQIDKRPNPHGVPLQEVKEEKQREIEALQELETKELVAYTKAMSLLAVDGIEINNYNEKVATYNDLTRRAFFEIIEFFDRIEFGINHKIDIPCPSCGKTEERWLQSNFNPIELLPLESNTIRDKGHHTKLNIYFGV